MIIVMRVLRKGFETRQSSLMSIKRLKTTKLMQDTVALVARKDAGSPNPLYKCHLKYSKKYQL